MRDLYRCEAGGDVDRLFHVHGDSKLSSIVRELDPGQTWTGRIYPQANRYGIASVDVMVQREAKGEAKVWLYTLEHPKVDGEVRYSSRSELKMLRVLLDNTLEYIFFRDLEGRFILTNSAFRAAVSAGGKAPRMDNTISDFVSEEGAEWFGGLDRRLVETEQAVVNEVSSVTLNSGLEHWLQLSIVPVRNDEGETIGTLSVARDISDLKRTEEELREAIDQARAASRTKGDFLAAMSHEIRTPINGIIGASELFEETRLDGEQRSYIDTVLQCGKTLLGLVNDVLDFSKIEAGRLKLEKLGFAPRTLMENVSESFIHETRKKGLELITAYDGKLPLSLTGDPTRLQQVLNNLVSNAVKFTEVGEVVVRAETLEISARSARVRFSVSDTGIGIAGARKKAIFESFTQGDMSTTRKYGGTGLGLSISQQLVQMMGGEIRVTSEVGRGSSFAFELSFEPGRCDEAEAAPSHPERAGKRVLIVGDNAANGEVYSQMCAGGAYRCVIAEDGDGALAAMENALRAKDPFQVVILDQQMPGLSGLDVAGLIQSRSELNAMKLILLSSSLDRRESERASKMGIACALSKPVKRQALLEAILETFELAESGSRLSNESKALPEAEQPLDVLLVEDNSVNQIVAERRLKKLGHRVTLAGGSADALKAIRDRRFDCILMDIEMPDMDGYETTDAVREFEKENSRSPQYIVAMTAHALKGDKERCLMAGMNNYIAKPFREQGLKEVLRLALIHKERVEGTAICEESGFAAYLEALDKEDREDLMAVADIFLENLPSDLAKLRGALEEKDFKQCYFIVHDLKSVVGHFGLKNSVSRAEALENACEKESEQEVRVLAAELIEFLEMLSQEIKALSHETDART